MKPQEIYKSNEDITEKGLFKTTVLAGNGIFEIHKSWIGESLKKVEEVWGDELLFKEKL